MILAIIPIEYFWVNSFDVKTIIFNVFGLGWAKPFGAGGHLWYITMMMILYVAFIVFSRFRLDKWPMWIWFAILGGLVLLYWLYPSPFMTYSHAGPPLFLWVACLLFYKGTVMIKLVTRHRVVSLFISTTLAVGSWLLYVMVPDWHDAYKQWATLTTCLVGFMAFVVLMSIIQPRRESKLIKYLAGISYEYYLVHLPLLPVMASLIHDKWLSIPVWLLASWLSALAIQFISNLILKRGKTA